MSKKKLYKSKDNRWICGVCGGLAEYVGTDATIIRLIMVLFGCTGTGILAYLIAAIIIPNRPEEHEE